MNQSKCGYCYQPACSECKPAIVGHVGFGPEIIDARTIFTVSDSPPAGAHTVVTLRDQVAMASLRGLLSSCEGFDGTVGFANYVSEVSYIYADAMLKARSK